MTWKVVDTSNHGIESIADVLIKDGFPTREAAQTVADEYNKDRDDYSRYWATVMDSRKALWRGMEELV